MMWQFAYPIGAAFYLISFYPEWRDGIMMLTKDAISLIRWLFCNAKGSTYGSKSASFLHGNSGTDKTLIQHGLSCVFLPPRRACKTQSYTKSLFSAGSILVEPYKTYQGNQIPYELWDTARQLNIPVEPYPAIDSYSISNFAQVALDFVVLKISQYENDGHMHRFFVFHPDNAWMVTFQRLLQGADFYSSSLADFECASHNLFVLCRWMLCVRVALAEAMGEEGRQVRFHILIPTCEPLVIPRQLSFIDALYPLTIEGPVRRGKLLVWMRIAPSSSSSSSDMLRDVGALPCPCPESADSKASVAICVLWIITSPMVVLVYKLVCSSDCPIYIALFLFVILHGCGLVSTLWLKNRIKAFYLEEESVLSLG